MLKKLAHAHSAFALAATILFVASTGFCGAPKQLLLLDKDGKDSFLLEAEEEPLDGLSILIVIAPKNFQDQELLYVYRYLRDYGAKTTIASTVTRPVYGMGGLKVKPKARVTKIKTKDYDGVLFIGGSGVPYIWGNPYVIRIAKDFHKANKLVAAICLAPVILAKAKILTKKKATVWPCAESLQVFYNEKVDYQKKLSVVSALKDRVITANGPTAAPRFSAEVIRFLWLIREEEKEKKRKIAATSTSMITPPPTDKATKQIVSVQH